VLKLIDFSTAIHISDDEVHEDSFGTLPYVAPGIYALIFGFAGFCLCVQFVLKYIFSDIIEFRANHPRTGKVGQKNTIFICNWFQFNLRECTIQVLKSCDMWSLGAMLFVLLTGLSPFPGQHTEDIELLIIFGQFEWPSNISLSENAKNFVERLMIVDWAARMTAEQALSHPWINESNSTNSPIEASASLDANIIQFEAISSLKKSIQNLLFKSSSDIQKHLRKMFAEFDADRDDLLDQTELTNYLEQFEPAADRYASEFISSTDAFQQARFLFLFFDPPFLVIICQNRVLSCSARCSDVC
jgi:serine/threonine protein kinase